MLSVAPACSGQQFETCVDGRIVSYEASGDQSVPPFRRLSDGRCEVCDPGECTDGSVDAAVDRAVDRAVDVPLDRASDSNRPDVAVDALVDAAPDSAADAEADAQSDQ